MADFDRAYAFTLDIEKGFSNNSNDRGGATNFGITLATLTRYLGRDATEDDIRNLSPVDARAIMKKYYWDYFSLDALANQILATIIYDQAVNRGTGGITRELQAIYKLPQDGVFGPQTLSAISGTYIEATRVEVSLIELAQRFYIRDAKHDASQMEFLEGWINRTHLYYRLMLGIS